MITANNIFGAPNDELFASYELLSDDGDDVSGATNEGIDYIFDSDDPLAPSDN